MFDASVCDNKNDFEITEPDTVSGSFRIGLRAIKSVEVEIGGQAIDKHYGDWLHIWNELSQSPGKSAGYAEMVGNVPALTQIYYANKKNEDCKTPEYTLYIPLQFWFCRNPGLALPLIALQYHEVKINIQLKKLEKIIDEMPSIEYDFDWDKDQKGIDLKDVLDEGKRIAVVMPESAGDVLWINSLMTNLKKLPVVIF